MAINFTTAFARIGKLGFVLSHQNAYQGTTLPADVAAIVGLYLAGDEVMIDGIQSQLSSAQGSAGGLGSYLSQTAVSTLNAMVFADNPQSSKTNLLISMKEFIRQMNVASATVQSAAQTGTVTFSGLGNGVLVASTKDGNGAATEYMLSENVKVQCLSDSSGGVAAGNEGFQALGQVASQNGPLAWDWPQGSGATQSLNAVNAAALPGQQGQLLANGDFENFTVPNLPNGWAISVGTAGTTVKKSTSPVYTGAGALQIVGTGAELTSLSQQFALPAGTSQVLKGGQQYAFNCWIQVSSVPAAGVLSVELVDGSGTVLQDISGANNAVTKALNTATTGWLPLNGTFRTPHALPPVYKLRLRLTTALTAAVSLYLDRLALTPVAPMYQGGPSLAIFSGSLPFYVGDTFTVNTVNAHPVLSVQRLAQRFFGMPSLGLVLPSTGSPSILDGVIS